MRSLIALAIVISVLLAMDVRSAYGAATLSIYPVSWNVIGLDSNNVNVGPEYFPVGARVCNESASITTVSVRFYWDDGRGVYKSSVNADAYINLRDGTIDGSGTITPTPPYPSSGNTISLSLAAKGATGDCKDAYFEAQVNRIDTAYNHTRAYHITATNGSGTISTTTPRELFVEHLVSQSRNSVTQIDYGPHGGALTSVAAGGTMTLLVGQEYDIKVTGATATNGYEQSETFISLPNTIFQVLSVTSTYNADTSTYVDSPNDKLYGDACKWESNLLSPNYRTCLDVGKVGGNITELYHVKILQVPGAPLVNPEPLSTLIYDFSGSSYHYNADFGATTRYAQILDYSQVGLTKKFNPFMIEPNGTSTMTIAITNPFNITLTGVDISDPFPAGMKTTTPAVYSTTGCGSPTFAPGDGVGSISFTGGTLYPNGTCTITVKVTAPGNGTTTVNYPNTTGHLFVGGTDTNKTASATLSVGLLATKPAVPSTCTVNPTALVTWNFDGGNLTPTIPAGSKASSDSSFTYARTNATSPGFAPIITGVDNSWYASGWNTSAGATPPPLTDAYYEFSVDTRKYAFVRISFDIELTGNSNWASATSTLYAFSSKDGAPFTATNPATFTSKKTNADDTKWTVVSNLIAETGTTDNTGLLNTIFRIYPTGNTNGIAWIDNVTITGCSFIDPPTLAKSFSPNPVAVTNPATSTSTLTFAVTNPATNIGTLSGITFDDDLPAGLDVTTGTISACSGTATLTAASGSTPAHISFVRASALAIGGTCNIAVPVIPRINAVFDNISGYISATESGKNATSTGYGTASLTAYLPPQITKTYSPDSIYSGDTSHTTYVITNPNSFNSLTGINFTDLYAAGVTNTGTLTITNNTCGVAISGSGGGNSIGIQSSANLTLAAGQSCTFTVDVTATTASTTPVQFTSSTTVHATGTSGSTGATGALTLDGNTATDSLFVKAKQPILTLLKQVGTVNNLNGAWSSSDVITSGTSVYYKFTVTNTGDVDFTSLSLDDAPLATALGVANPIPCTWYKSDPANPTADPPVYVTTTTLPANTPAAPTADPVAYCLVGPASAVAGGKSNTATVTGATASYGPATASDTAVYMNGNFGHLPSVYTNMNIYNDGGAFHLNGTTRFGTNVTTTDSDGINTATYTPKSTDDGVTYTTGVPWSVATGGSIDIAPTGCSVAKPCYVYGWIDFNQDGDFNEPGETIINGVSYTADGWTTVPFSIPAGTNFTGTQTFYSRFRIYNEPPTSPQPYGVAMNGTTTLTGEIEDPFFKVINGVVTPVTVSYFEAEQHGDQVDFNWSTATESGNLGFNLYVQRGGAFKLLNQELIPSKVIDSLSQQDYSFSAQTDGTVFFVEDVDAFGQTRRHGPFQLGKTYGDQIEASTIDWAAIQNASNIIPVTGEDLEAERGTTTALYLKVRQTGMYRVTYETLRTAGLDLAGVDPATITLTLSGRAAPIYIYSTQKTFGTGGYIEFFGRALNTLYTDTNVYTLQVSTVKSPRIAVNTIAPLRTVKPAAAYMETLTVDNQRTYTNYTPGNDPWYDNYVFRTNTTNAASFDFPFVVNGLASSNAASTLNLAVWGMSETPHHAQVSINGVQVSSQTFDGIVEKIIKATIPAGILRNGANTLTVTLPASTDSQYDLVYMDKFSVTYPHSFRAQDGKLTFTAADKVFRVTNLPTPNVVVYQLVNNRMVRLSKVTVKASGSTYTATFAGSTTLSTYYVATVEAMPAPEVAAALRSAGLNRPADYLVISHPAFIQGLQPLVQARQAQGFTVNVVNVNSLYAKYTYGVFDPSAIKQYIAYAAQNLGTKYVLLVGGDTYDYRNYLKDGQGNPLNSISFIPSLYVATSDYAKFVPADPLYTDLNGDKVPDLAIGRFPVRSLAELDLMINKTLAYQNKDYGRTALFSSDIMDSFLSFKNISDGFSSSLTGWSSTRINLDDYYFRDAQGSSQLNVASARDQLIQAMNNGAALVTFTGHSSPTKWTFSGLFKSADAAALTNAGRPFVLVQWGCWNTYYVDPVNNYLVQSFLFSGDKGAAAVLGASTLTDSTSDAMLGKLLMPRLVNPGMTLGQALQDAKHELALAHPDLLDVLLGWSLMGDPALVVEP
jgi:hypothetical protein